MAADKIKKDGDTPTHRGILTKDDSPKSIYKWQAGPAPGMALVLLE